MSTGETLAMTEIMGRCQECSSDDIASHGLEYAGPSTATEDIVCRSCGARFQQRYEVTRTELINGGEA